MTIYGNKASPAVGFHGVQAMNYGRFPLGGCLLTNGSPNVVGTGTHFLSQIEVGYQLNNQDTAVHYVVQSITDDTHLTLTGNVSDTTNSYDCSPDFLVSDSTFTRMPLRGPNFWDTDGFHFTDHSALSGTVTKSNASAIITGSGTSFLSQLSVNQIVDVPGGGGTDTLVVKSITDNTHFVAWTLPAYSASGQTATKNPDCLAIPAGITNGAIGNFTAYIYYAWTSRGGVWPGGSRNCGLLKNVSTGVTIGAQNQIQGDFVAADTTSETDGCVALPFQAVDGDALSVTVWQNSGGALGLTPNFPAGTTGGTGGFAYGLTVKFDGIPA